VLTDALWEVIVCRYRAGAAWRDIPAEFGPWPAVWKRHRRFSIDESWNNRTVTKVTIY